MMANTLKLVLIGAVASVVFLGAEALTEEEKTSEVAGREFMRKLNLADLEEANKEANANWNYLTNLTDTNEQINTQVQLEGAKKYKAFWEETIQFKSQNFQDEDLKRKFKKYSILGTDALPEAENQQLIQDIQEMIRIYSTATVCDYRNRTKCDLQIDPDISAIFESSQDPEELKYYWVEWHKVSGAAIKPDYVKYVELENKASKANGFDNYAEFWLEAYEQPDFEHQLAELWHTVKPLYQQLHAYVRRQLRLKHGDQVVSAKGPIPGHLLGNMWAHHFREIAETTKPFPNKAEVDITNALVQQNYTPLSLIKTAEDFYVSLNMSKLPETFYEKSLLVKPNDRDVSCASQALDFFDGKDFRIKQCGEVSSAYYETAYFQVGTVEYFMAYKDLPIIYRNGANPGFFEAVGDSIYLSAASPKHLNVLGLQEDNSGDFESKINTLYAMAMYKVALLPYAYLLDSYRYSIFRGQTTPDNYNCHFWKFREVIQGIEPPVKRTEEDFDAGAKASVSADNEYMQYYVAFIMQFQFHRSLCELAGQYTEGNDEAQPLFNCDIYKSTAAGNAFEAMLALGSSKPWPDALEALTGQREIDAVAILDYFKPLHEWLKTENEKTGEYIGWEETNFEFCTSEQVCELENSEFLKKLKKQSGN